MTQQPRWIGAAEVRERVSPDRARRLIRLALADGLDPALDPARLSVEVGPTAGRGQVLVMPSASERAAGVKVLSVAPANPEQGLERIQALYVLLDAQTLAPTVLIDGGAITALRTPATTAVAVDALAPPEVAEVVIFGSGPQAVGHVDALLAIREPARITLVARDLGRCSAVARQLSGLGPIVHACAADDRPRVAAAVRAAQVVVAATSSATPVLDGTWVADGACVAAVGSHEPDRRELDAELVGRSLVVVEDVATALREAGDVTLAMGEGTVRIEDLHSMADLVRGELRRATDRPNVFKSVGMAWQDLVIADGVTRG